MRVGQNNNNVSFGAKVEQGKFLNSISSGILQQCGGSKFTHGVIPTIDNDIVCLESRKKHPLIKRIARSLRRDFTILTGGQAVPFSKYASEVIVYSRIPIEHLGSPKNLRQAAAYNISALDKAAKHDELFPYREDARKVLDTTIPTSSK